MSATVSPAISSHLDAEKDAWMRLVLGIDVAGDGPVPGKGGHAASVAPLGVDEGAASPGKPGWNFVRQLVLPTSFPIPGIPAAGGGLGLGVGVGMNNGKKQYFLVGRGALSGAPKASGGVSVETIGSSSPILNRSDASRTATFTFPPLAAGAGHPGPVAINNQVVTTASHFHNKNADVLLGGSTNSTSFKIGGAVGAVANVSFGMQAVENFRRRPAPTDADALQKAAGRSAEKPLGQRPLRTVDKNIPILFTASASLGAANSGAKKPVAPIQGSVTYTWPIDEEKTPAWIKDLLQRVALAQRSPNPKDLLRLLQDIESSPQLRKRLLNWELEELKHVPAPHPGPAQPQVHHPLPAPYPVPAPHPVLVPDPGWATRVGHSLRDAASNWRPPTPAQQTNISIAAALTTLGAFIVANPEFLLLAL